MTLKIASNREMGSHRCTYNTEKRKCDICGVGFRDKIGVEQHRGEFHKEALFAECPDCGERYKDEISLNSPQQKIHPGEESIGRGGTSLCKSLSRLCEITESNQIFLC